MPSTKSSLVADPGVALWDLLFPKNLHFVPTYGLYFRLIANLTPNGLLQLLGGKEWLVYRGRSPYIGARKSYLATPFLVPEFLPIEFRLIFSGAPRYRCPLFRNNIPFPEALSQPCDGLLFWPAPRYGLLIPGQPKMAEKLAASTRP
jgi:hypothetical protein